MTGCSVRTAQLHTVGYRKAMIVKRDRQAAGQSVPKIAQETGLPKSTVHEAKCSENKQFRK
jgi:hypothetical protein